MNNANENKTKQIQNYANTMKKTLPISIVTGRDTIFIKTKPNKLAYNYINNGKQIKNNNILINSINQSSDINKSLKNTFTLYKQNNIKSLNGTKVENKNKNLNNSKLNDLIQIKKISNNNIHYRGTNSFIKMNRRNNKNYSNINNSSNHIFNFYNFINKMNDNSSIKGKNKTKNKINQKEVNKNINKKNNFNFTYLINKKSNKINPNTNEKRNNLKGKKVNTSINRSSYQKKYNYSNNLSSITKEYIAFRTIGNEKDNNFKTNRGQFYLAARKLKFENKNNKYIYSKEKKKEKSLAEKRNNAKKPISYLAKINSVNENDTKKHIKSNIIINLNNINNRNNSNERNKEKDKKDRITNYNRNNYDLNIISNTNYDYHKTENTIKIKKSNNELFNINNNNEIKVKTGLNKNVQINNNNNKNNLFRSNTIEKKANSSSNNIVNNNNYYSINNTFIFDTVGQKLIQYDLSKFIQDTKNNHSMNINLSNISNYNNNIYHPNNYRYKTISADIDNNSDININNVINKNIKLKNANKIITKENKINKDNDDYINVVINDKDNNKYNIQKFSSYKLSNIINNKKNHNNTDLISNNNKLLISNIDKKESKEKSIIKLIKIKIKFKIITLII